MEQIFKKLIGYTLYTLLCGVIFYYIAIPKIIERRAKLSGWDLYYLQYGNMNGY